MKRRHLFGAAAAVAATAALLGGVLAGTAGAARLRATPQAAVASRSTGSPPVTRPRRSPARAPRPRQPRGRRGADASRPRLRAARPRDRRPGLLSSLRGGAPPRAPARAGRRPRFDGASRRSPRPAIASREARDLARKARSLNSYSAAALGILGDANVETGRYRRRLRGVRPHGRDEALGRRLRAHLLRARAPRPHRGRDRGDEARGLGSGAAPTSRRRGRSSSSGTSTSTAGDCAPQSAQYRAALARFPGYHRARPRSRRVAAARGRTRRGGRASTGVPSKPCRCPSTPPGSVRRSPQQGATPRRPRPMGSST